MRFAFFSNFLNHHQLPFCLELYKHLGDSFHFVATTPVHEEQLALGYEDMNKKYPFVVRTYEDDAQKELAYKLALEADVVVIGSAPMGFIKRRLEQSKLTLHYAERIYKTGYQAWKLPIRFLKHFWKYGRYKNYYLLGASAYAAGDYAKTGLFINKAYKWGYFPEVKQYESIEKLIEAKAPNTLLWAGRFISWKHPEYAVTVAARLKRDGYRFKLRMIGRGDMETQLRQQIRENDLEDCVELMGSMSPEQVRSYMEQSQIYLITSDRNEGWGAVLNESMNSCCAVVASDAIGAVPFLLKNGENGMIFASGDTEDLYRKVKQLLDDPELGCAMGKKAYETLSNLWNAETAAQRLVKTCAALLEGEKYPLLYTDGPCSKAQIIHNKHDR